MAEFKRTDDAMRQKDGMMKSFVSSLKDQMTVLGLARQKLAYIESSLEPERAAQWSRKFPPSTSTEQRPEMAKRSEEVAMANGRDPHQNSGTS